MASASRSGSGGRSSRMRPRAWTPQLLASGSMSQKTAVAAIAPPLRGRATKAYRSAWPSVQASHQDAGRRVYHGLDDIRAAKLDLLAVHERSEADDRPLQNHATRRFDVALPSTQIDHQTIAFQDPGTLQPPYNPA